MADVVAEWNGQARRIGLLAEPYMAEMVKRIPGARWNTKELPGCWSVPLTTAACRQLRTTFGAQLRMGERLREWAKGEKTHETALERLRAAVVVDTPLGTDEERLRPFQVPGVRWMVWRGGGLLADETGSGKTVQMANVLKRLSADCLPALIVAPMSTLYGWERELQKWCPGITTSIVTGAAAARRKALAAEADVVIVGQANLREHTRLATYGDVVLKPNESKPRELQEREYRTVVVDEAQCMADPHSKVTRACWYMLHRAQYRYLLTATPPTEPWCLLHGLDPVTFPVRTAHLKRYFEESWGEWGGIRFDTLKEDMRAEYEAIVQPYIRALPKAVTMPYLPPIQGGLADPMIRAVDLTSKQEKAYKELLKQSMAWLEKDGGDEELSLATSMAAKMARLRMLLSAYLEPGERTRMVDGQPIVEPWAYMAEPSSKLDALMELLGEHSHEPVVVFAQSRQLVRLASKRLEKVKLEHGLIEGGQNLWERQQYVDRFQAGQLPVMLVVTQAGGAGVNLHRSRVAVFLQRTGSLTWEKQAEGRVHRDGSEVHESVLIYDVMAQVESGAPEMRLLELLREVKSERLEDLLKTKALARYVFTGER